MITRCGTASALLEAPADQIVGLAQTLLDFGNGVLQLLILAAAINLATGQLAAGTINA